MKNTKREFLKGVGFGAAGLFAAAAGTSLDAAEAKAGAKSGAFFNVQDFGAKGDGKTSDSPAIQKALDAAGEVSGTVYFPAGKYLCKDLKVHRNTALLAEPKWAYRGDGGAMLILEDENASCVLDITRAYGVHICGLFLRGIKGAKKTIHGIYLNNPSVSPEEDCVVVDDCKIQNFSGHGLYLQRVWLFIIRRNIMQSNGGCGVMLRGWDGFVMDNQFASNGSHGFGSEERVGTVKFTANRVEWNGGHGLHLNAGSTWNVTGNCFDRNWGAALNAEDMKTLTITGNIFRRNGKDNSAVLPNEKSCQLRLVKCRGVTCVSNAAAAGRDDNNKGVYTPQVGMILKELECAAISLNAFFEGYTETLLVDEGSHKGETYIEHNLGTAFKI